MTRIYSKLGRLAGFSSGFVAALLTPSFLQPSALAQNSASTEQPTSPVALKRLSLEELSQIDVTTPSREPVPAFRTPAAIYVITGEDIRRSGATTIPDALRLAPGVEVAQISGDKWSVGIRGFGTRLSRDVLVLIDGRTVYTPIQNSGKFWRIWFSLNATLEARIWESISTPAHSQSCIITTQTAHPPSLDGGSRYTIAAMNRYTTMS